MTRRTSRGINAPETRPCRRWLKSARSLAADFQSPRWLFEKTIQDLEEYMKLTPHETATIATFIEPIFSQYVSRYSFAKYPAAEYARYKSSYSSMDPKNNDIQASLVWKYGHRGKPNFPSKQKALITRVEALWLDYVQSPKCIDAESTFLWWRSRLPATAYITAAYITHLVHHAAPLPIIDQHNFRAMNSLLKRNRSDHEATRVPRSWNDIENLRDFMSAVLCHLPGKTFGELDQFLMMYGQSIKPRKTGRKRQPFLQ